MADVIPNKLTASDTSQSSLDEKSILSESEIDRIKAEERLRAQLREELTPKSPKKNAFIEFLNSSLGLLLISGLLISGIGQWASAEYNDIKSAKQTKKEAVKYLTELSERTFLMDIWIKNIESSTNDKDKIYNSAGIIGVKEAVNGWYTPIYLEFKQVPIQALITWFKLNVLNNELTNDALKKVQGLRNGENQMVDVSYAKLCVSTLRDLEKEIAKEIEE